MKQKSKKINKKDRTVFTLAKSATLADNIDNIRRSAFTLAEALITIGIIGVVAAILLPTLVREVTLKVDSSREANIAQKITKAMENMSVNDDFGTFEDTEAFVDSLQKYLKIAKRCDAEHIADCWPTNTVKGSKGETIQVSEATTGEKLHVKGNTNNNVGLVLADGGSIILTYDNTFEGFSPDTFFTSYTKNLPIGFGKYQDFAYSSSVTAPIDYVVDVNGGLNPNRETSYNGEKMFDIRSFRGASFGKGTCPGKVLSDGMCIKTLSGFEPIDCRGTFTAGDDWKYCAALPSGGGIAYIPNPDYWSGSFKACEKIGMSYYTDYRNSSSMVSQGIIPDTEYFQIAPNDNNRGAGKNNPNTSVICVKE